MKVFFHTRTKGKRDWVNEHYEFARIPVKGEHVATKSDSPWYEVQLVVHTPFPADCDAEVYAVEVDHMEVKKQAFDD